MILKMHQKTKTFIAIAAAATMCAVLNAKDAIAVHSFDKEMSESKQDEFSTMKSMLGKAMKEETSGVKIVFEKKLYELKHCPTDFAFINAEKIKNLEIDGNGATVVLDPANSFLRIQGCENITVKNFTITYSPSPFTQGVISDVNPSEGSFSLTIDKGYPLLPDDAKMREHYGEKCWQWGSVMDSKIRQRKRGVSDHYFIDCVEKTSAPDKFKIIVDKSYADRLKGVSNGDRFAMPVYYFKDNRKNNFTPNVAVGGSSNITVENITLYRNRNSMCFWIGGNRGKVTMRGNNITWLPNSNDIIASWRDGYHCKSNETGPTIENCRCEGLLDDSINISTDTIMIKRVLDEKTLELTNPGFTVGDEMGLLYIDSAKWIDGIKVVEAKGNIVTLDTPVKNIKTGEKRPHTDKESTQVYNMKRVNKDFKIKDCFFGMQRRNAMLIRAFNGRIEGNTVEESSANGISLGNETGWFYEGPFPRNITIKENTFKNLWDPGVSLYSSTSANAPINVNFNIKILKNTFIKDSSSPYPPAIYVSKVRGAEIKNNIFKTSSEKILPPESAVKIYNSENIEVGQE